MTSTPQAIAFVTAEDIRKIVREELQAIAQGSKEGRKVSAAELAAMRGVSVATVRNWVNRDGLPCEKLGPKLLRFKLSEVEEWERGRAKNVGGVPSRKRAKRRMAKAG